MQTLTINPDAKAPDIAAGGQSFDLRKPITMPYVEQGEASGIPVVMLHGYSDSWRSFERLLPHLPTSLRAIALSQRGHGEATRPAASAAAYHPEVFAADLAAFLDMLQLESAVIVGHCMGSYIAQRFALDYPERVRALVLVGSFTTLQGNPGAQELSQSVSQLADPIDPDFVWEFQRSTVARDVPQQFLEAIVKESLKMPARVWKAALEALLEADFSQQIATITAPTLIVWGDQDALIPRCEQEALASRIAGSQLMVYAGTGHAPHWEEPERFAADLVNFISSF